MKVPQPIRVVGSAADRYAALVMGAGDRRIGTWVTATAGPFAGVFVIQPLTEQTIIQDDEWLICYTCRITTANQIVYPPVRIDLLDPRDRSVWFPQDVRNS